MPDDAYPNICCDHEQQYLELARHHRECELAGERMAQLIKQEVYTGMGGVDDDDLIAAVAKWDEHQWPT